MRKINLEKLMLNLYHSLKYFASVPKDKKFKYKNKFENEYHEITIDPDGKKRHLLKERSYSLSQMREITDFLDSIKPGKILDFGCGSGEFAYSASELVDTTVVGYDLFPPNNSYKSNVAFLNSEQSIKALGPYQLIFAFQVIEHVSNPRMFLEFLYSQLDSGGYLVIETPSSSGMLFSSISRSYWGGWHAPRHFLIFDKKSLTNLSTELGFQVESFQFIPSPFQWIETIRALLGKNSRLNKYLHLGNFLIVATVYLIDSIAIFLRFKSSNMKIVLRKI